MEVLRLFSFFFFFFLVKSHEGVDPAQPVAPVAHQVILEPGIGQLREPSAYSHKFVGTFSCAHIDLRKARERELATLDEKPTSSGIAEPYAR